jgi:restriction endonuclease Mrr
MECSYVLTGKVLDAINTVNSSAYAAFEGFIDLKPFGREDSREIILRNLGAFRIREEPGGFTPFEPPTVDRIIRDAAGIPRAINAIAYQVLDSAIAHEIDAGEPVPIDLDFYDLCLSTLGAQIYADSTDQERDVLRRIRQHGGYLDMADAARYFADGFQPEASAPVMEKLAENDKLLKTETATNVVYTLAASAEHFFAAERAWKQGLEERWRDVAAEGLTAAEKGDRLEDFAAELFGRVFKVVGRKVRTATEEHDVVLEFSGGDPIWAKAPTILVECKNWSEPVPQKEISALATKARLCACDLSFLVSTSGFTKDARMQARDHNLADQANGRLVVLVSGADIEGFLSRDNVETADDFLKKLRRRAQLRDL